MKEVKCKNCGKTLGELKGKLKIRCKKCKQMNYIEIK